MLLALSNGFFNVDNLVKISSFYLANLIYCVRRAIFTAQKELFISPLIFALESSIIPNIKEEGYLFKFHTKNQNIHL
jgi:hypothetical protein